MINSSHAPRKIQVELAYLEQLASDLGVSEPWNLSRHELLASIANRAADVKASERPASVRF